MSGYKQGPDWCMTEPQAVDIPVNNLRMNKVPFRRCPKCKRRLQLKVSPTPDISGETYMMYPAHKIRKTKR